MPIAPGHAKQAHGPPAPPRGYGTAGIGRGPYRGPAATAGSRLFHTQKGPVGRKVPRARPSGGIAPSGVHTLLNRNAGRGPGARALPAPGSGLSLRGRREIYVAAEKLTAGALPPGPYCSAEARPVGPPAGP